MHIKNTAAKKTHILGQINMATFNLYQLAYERGRKSMLSTDDMIQQLAEIKKYVKELTYIDKEMRKELTKADPKVSITILSLKIIP